MYRYMWNFCGLGSFAVIMFQEHYKGVWRRALCSFGFLVTIYAGHHMDRRGNEDMAHTQKGVLIPVFHRRATRVKHKSRQCIHNNRIHVLQIPISKVQNERNPLSP